ncbi:hypothetical protein BJ741DRAFT_665753 [Chytriomyces cf. hyalinus JEL632]|nr:hypothetical protein BJ741DRAFT_665753 [Chytriomyces cf. hyalinus JEL632]
MSSFQKVLIQEVIAAEESALQHLDSDSGSDSEDGIVETAGAKAETSLVSSVADIALNWALLPFLNGLFFRGFNLILKVRKVVAANKRIQ